MLLEGLGDVIVSLRTNNQCDVSLRGDHIVNGNHLQQRTSGIDYVVTTMSSEGSGHLTLLDPGWKSVALQVDSKEN